MIKGETIIIKAAGDYANKIKNAGSKKLTLYLDDVAMIGLPVVLEEDTSRGLNDVANHADSDILKKKYKGNIIDVSPVEFISITINGGYNGMDDRKKYYSIAEEVLT